MKKRIIAALLATTLVMVNVVGCGSSDSSSSTTDSTEETTESADSGDEEVDVDDLPVLRVAVQPYFVSAEVGYIVDNGLDIANGFVIETVLFTNGTTINEALSTDSFDIAPTGGAYVYGAANFDAKVIGCHLDGSGGNEVWITSDSDMASVTGYNSDYPDILGSAETVEGITILQTTGTTSQYVATKWLEAIGADLSTVNVVNMEIAQVYNAFVAGEGEAAALSSPYCYQTDEETTVLAATADGLDINIFEETIIPNRVYEDESMTDLIVSFMTVLYEVGTIFEENPEIKFEAVYKWYQDNGSTATEEDVQAECDLKQYVTTEDLLEMDFGAAELEYATFCLDQDMITEDGYEAFQENLVTDYMDLVIAGLE